MGKRFKFVSIEGRSVPVEITEKDIYEAVKKTPDTSDAFAVWFGEIDEDVDWGAASRVMQIKDEKIKDIAILNTFVKPANRKLCHKYGDRRFCFVNNETAEKEIRHAKDFIETSINEADADEYFRKRHGVGK